MCGHPFHPRRARAAATAAALAIATLSGGGGASAQLDERPGGSLDNPIDVPRDLSGLSIKNPRVRAVHTTDPALAGGSMYLQQVDPWLGYQRGRNLTQRQFRARDGVFGEAGRHDGPLLTDGSTHMMSRGHASSCGVCHNVPHRDGGAGVTIAKNSGTGRNTPHFFGGGLIEMIGLQLRLDALAVADGDRNGWISHDEAAGRRCVIASVPDGAAGDGRRIDYGRFDDLDGDGRPDLDEVFKPIYVDEHGRRLATASRLDHPEVAGYTLEVQVFGFGHRHVPNRPPVATTLRSFAAGAFDTHSGLQAYDPTVLDDLDGDGFSRVSNAGAAQCVTAAGRDRGRVRDQMGNSLDDPDRDGFCQELSEGDLDLVEWYMLNHPAPGRGPVTAAVRRGEALFARVGCTSCHVADWHLHAADPDAADYTKRYDGDRRFFELIVEHDPADDRLEGRLVMLADRRGDLLIPRRDAVTVRGIYSDFRYHDLGPALHEIQYDGSLVMQTRTTPLWGVGTTGPWGHDGASLTLPEVIGRHSGEALQSRRAFESLAANDRAAVIAFLQSLVLYQTDALPADVDGDGRISEHFVVAGQDTGLERLDPQWLFRVPGRVEGPVRNLQGQTVLSLALTNVTEAYGLNLPLLRDGDADGFPDVTDPDPDAPGYRTGRADD